MLLKMKMTILVAALTLVGSSALGADRVAAIQSAEQLHSTGVTLGNLAKYQCRCPNSARVLYELAEIAVDVELEARFGTAQEATQRLRGVLRKIRELKPYADQIPNPAIKLRIKKETLIGINELGRAIMGTNWVIVREQTYTETSSGGRAAYVSVFEGLEENLEGEPDSEF